MAKKESFYKNSVVAKPSKKILPYLLDYLINFVLTIIFYVIINLIATNFSFVSEIQTSASATQTELYSLVSESGLSYQGEDGYLIPSDTRIEYLIKEELIYVFTLEDDTSKLSSAIYSGYDALDLEDKELTDPLYYYYTIYKPENLDSYNEDYESLYGYDYFIYTILDLDNNSDYFAIGLYEEDPSYPLINYDTASLIHEYLRDSDYSLGEDAYNVVYDLYYAGINTAMDDLIYGNESYIELNDKYEGYVNHMLNIRGNCLLLAFLISTLIVYLLMPTILREGRTIGLRAFRLACHDIKGNKVGFLNNFIRWLITLFSSFSELLICIFVIFTSEGMYFLNVYLLGFINIFVLGVISLIFALISFLFTLFMRKTHQNIEEILSMLIVVNAEEFIVKDKEEPNEIETKKEEIEEKGNVLPKSHELRNMPKHEGIDVKEEEKSKDDQGQVEEEKEANNQSDSSVDNSTEDSNIENKEERNNDELVQKEEEK